MIAFIPGKAIRVYALFLTMTMLVVRACLHSFPDRAIRRILMAYRPSQVRHTTWGRVSVPPLATEDEPQLHQLA